MYDVARLEIINEHLFGNIFIDNYFLIEVKPHTQRNITHKIIVIFYLIFTEGTYGDYSVNHPLYQVKILNLKKLCWKIDSKNSI